jgi:hypothetical protein
MAFVRVSVSVCVCVFAHRLVHTGKRPRRSVWYLSGCVGVCLRAHSLVFVCMQGNGRAGVDGGSGRLLSVVYCIEGIARAHTHTQTTHTSAALFITRAVLCQGLRIHTLNRPSARARACAKASLSSSHAPALPDPYSRHPDVCVCMSVCLRVGAWVCGWAW